MNVCMKTTYLALRLGAVCVTYCSLCWNFNDTPLCILMNFKHPVGGKHEMVCSSLISTTLFICCNLGPISPKAVMIVTCELWLPLSSANVKYKRGEIVLVQNRRKQT